jgi:cell division protein FtsI (penicillin-binding protein 3)
MKSADVRRSARRVEIVRVVFLLAFAALAIRAAHLAVFDQRGLVRGDAQSLRTLTLPPERGQIVDRSGAALALSIDAPSVYAIPQRLADPADTAAKLARILGLDRGRLEQRLAERRAFGFVARWVQPERAEQVEALSLAGVGVLQEPRRVYPHRALAARVIGFANIDGRGVRGLEQQEDEWLRGTTRRLPVERDGGGRLMLVSGGATWGTAGGDVALTLDAAMQADAERALAEAIDRTGALAGVVISMDPYTGEVFSLAESPSFDPNHFRTLDYDTTRSAAFLDAVEPGSAFKSFLIAGALEAGVIGTEQAIDCGDGTLRIPGKTIRDARAHGELDAAGILRVSSNVGVVRVAQALGESAHFDMLQRFGFGRPTGSRFPDESAGLLRPWKQWRPIDQATIAFGQGVSVTPIQLAAATAALANGGSWVRPRMVAARRVAGGPWQPTSREVPRRVLRPETADAVLAMLETVVSEEGTGRRAALGGVRVAGKTGTAQKWDAEAGAYSIRRFRAWFVGIVPADAPKLVIVTGLDEPRRPLHTGGAAAAPLFARVAEAQLARFGIFATDPQAPSQTRVATAAAEPRPEPRQTAPREGTAAVSAAPAPAPAKRSASIPAPAEGPAAPPASAASLRDLVLLPDFSGLRVEEVTRITETARLIVRVVGEGRVIRQDPPPGTVVPSGGIVTIEFGETASGDRAADVVPATGGHS